MDLQEALDAKTQELEELQADYDELGKTFNELQDELEQVCTLFLLFQPRTGL